MKDEAVFIFYILLFYIQIVFSPKYNDLTVIIGSFYAPACHSCIINHYVRYFSQINCNHYGQGDRQFKILARPLIYI